MSLQPFSVRAMSELLWPKIDKEWIHHKLPKDDVYISLKDFPDQDQESRCYLLEADENWNDSYPANFCFHHRH